MNKHIAFKYIWLVASLSLIPLFPVYADPVIINNNTGQTPVTPQSQCNNNLNSTSNGTPPGSYTVKNGNGTTSQIYSTGEKQPYIVDNNCGQSSDVQPYVYLQPPIPGPTPRPGPKPRPR